jgi:hypothetical protein
MSSEGDGHGRKRGTNQIMGWTGWGIVASIVIMFVWAILHHFFPGIFPNP